MEIVLILNNNRNMKRLILFLIIFTACSKEDLIISKKVYSIKIDSVLNSSGTKSLLFDARIFDVTRRFTLTQHINLIKKADYLIAPDSYSKYIRRWVNGRQSILCTTLDYISNRSILEGCFGDFKNPNTAGLLFNPNVKLVGANYSKNLNIIEIVDNINDISPEEIFKSINLEERSCNFITM